MCSRYRPLTPGPHQQHSLTKRCATQPQTRQGARTAYIHPKRTVEMSSSNKYHE